MSLTRITRFAPGTDASRSSLPAPATVARSRRSEGESAPRATARRERSRAPIHHEDQRASQDDLTEALAILEELEPKMRKIFGNSHPHTRENREYLEGARMRREDIDAGIYSLD